MKKKNNLRNWIAGMVLIISVAFVCLRRWYFRLEWRSSVFPINFSGETYRGELLLICLISAVCIFAGIVFRNKRNIKVPYIVFALFMPLISMLIFEISLDINSEILNSFHYVFANYILISIFYAAALCITGSLRGSMIGTSLMLAVAAVINAYVCLFRSKPIYPMDFFSVKTAAGVAGHYDWNPSGAIITAVMMEAAVCCLWSECRMKLKGLFRLIPMVYAAAVIGLTGSILENLPSFRFNRESNGYVLNFAYALNNLKPAKPANYSVDESERIASEYGMISNEKKENLPDNVIVIMNESWSDITSLGDFSTSEDMFSFYNSLSDNTVKGNLNVSVFGGGTPNSEFEFLTGNTVASLPEDAIAFQLYINDHFPTLVSFMSGLGYETVSYHPERSSNYGREQVYSYLGFDRSYWEGDFDDGDNVFHRYLLSDSSDYKHLTKIFENKTDDKLFIFNVTSQSHGGYGYPEFDSFVAAEGLRNQYGTLNEYCTLTKLTDNALSELIRYFSEVDEKTLIVVFGDHQPSLENGFYDEIGQSADSPDRYVTKLLLWANYDIEEKTFDSISANYLPLLLLDAMGIETEGYPSFLKDLYEEYPVISYKGCYDKAGNYLSYEEAESSSALVHDYSVLQYNYIHNPSERLKNFFWEKDEESA